MWNLGNSVQLDITVLFSDIRSFTTLSEGMSPQDTFKFINSYESMDGELDENRKLKEETKEMFLKELELYNSQQFEDGAIEFEAVLAKNPVDKAAAMYVDRCSKFKGRQTGELGWSDSLKY